MRVLIIGGSGYLASCLSIYLSKYHEVVLGTRNPKLIKYKKKNIKIKKINYLSKKNLISSTKGFDAVIHLVGMNQLDSKTYKLKSLKIKKRITHNIIEACNYNKISKLIYISSIQVYKNFINKKKITEKSKVEKKNSYAKAHIEAEKIVLKNQNSTIIRLSNVFGVSIFHKTNELLNTMINNICHQAVNNKIIIKNPDTVRNFIPFKVFGKIVNLILIKKSIKIKLFNLGYKTFSLIEIAKKIQKRCIVLFNIKPEIETNIENKKIKKFIYRSKYFNFRYSEKIFINEIDNMLKIFRNEK